MVARGAVPFGEIGRKSRGDRGAHAPHRRSAAAPRRMAASWWTFTGSPPRVRLPHDGANVAHHGAARAGEKGRQTILNQRVNAPCTKEAHDAIERVLRDK